MKTKVLSGIVGLLFVASLSWAQGMMPMGGDFLAQQEQFLAKMKEKAPKLYEMEKKLMDAQKEIQGILKDYREKKIDRQEAAEKLKPLMKEQMEMRSSPDYMVEQMLMSSEQGFFGAPMSMPPQQKK